MRWIDRIKNSFKSKDSDIAEQNGAEHSAATAASTAILNKLLHDESGLVVSTGREFSFRKLLMDIGNIYWNTGKEDGKLGQNKTNLSEIAHVDAEFIKDDINSSYKAKVDQLESEVKIKEKIYDHAEKDYNDSKDFYEKAFKEFRRNPRYFSRGLAILYVTIAMLLIFADIPLALKLTQQGFDLDLGQNFQIRQLFENPFRVFQENWEVFILAFGVALCTIFIKIIYDEFVERPLEKVITQFKNLDGVDSDSEIEMAIIKRERKKRAKIKAIILSLTILTIISLGVFRYQTIEHQNRLEELSLTDQLSNENFFNSIDQPNITDSTIVSSNTTNSSNDGLRKVFTAVTFILITLLFPTVGGVCFSIGSNYWGNRKELNMAKELSETSKNAFLNASKDIEETIKKLANWRGALDWCNSPNFIGHIKRLFLNYYDHGYQRGMVEPDTSIINKDLFTRAEEFRNSLVSKGIYATLQNEHYLKEKAIPENEKLSNKLENPMERNDDDSSTKVS
jgi:hypothetical protein